MTSSQESKNYCEQCHSENCYCDQCAMGSLARFNKKIAFWSVGIIAASVFFVWTIISKNGVNINDNYWYVPLHWFLCISWICLTLSFALGLLTKRQCFLANFCAANSKKDKKDEKKYCCDMCIIYNVPAIFVVGVLLLLIFLSGSMKMVSQRGKVYDFSGERMMNKMHHMEKMMCDKEDFKKHEGMGMMMRKHQISPAAKE